MIHGLATSIPNADIEQKWYDSLVGFDKNDRSIRYSTYPIRQKYGNLNESGKVGLLIKQKQENSLLNV